MLRLKGAGINRLIAWSIKMIEALFVPAYQMSGFAAYLCHFLQQMKSLGLNDWLE